MGIDAKITGETHTNCFSPLVASCREVSLEEAKYCNVFESPTESLLGASFCCGFSAKNDIQPFSAASDCSVFLLLQVAVKAVRGSKLAGRLGVTPKGVKVRLIVSDRMAELNLRPQLAVAGVLFMCGCGPCSGGLLVHGLDLDRAFSSSAEYSYCKAVLTRCGMFEAHASESGAIEYCWFQSTFI